MDIDLRKINESVANVGMNVKELKEEGFIKKATNLLTPFRLIGTIIVAGIAISVAIKSCNQQKPIDSSSISNGQIISKSGPVIQNTTIESRNINAVKKHNRFLDKDTSILKIQRDMKLISKIVKPTDSIVQKRR